MVQIEPQIEDNSIFPIGKAAVALGISRDTLRKYTVSGAINHHIHKVNGRKLYKGDDLKRFWNGLTSS